MVDASMTLDDQHFTTFFREVTGFEPFAWQMDLVRRLLKGEIPATIEVPTGLGKTSVLHAWTYALAASLAVSENTMRRLPLRLFIVVDRRLIVDSTHDRARHLAEVLASPPTGAVAIPRVAAALKKATGGAGAPLAAVRMRGGVTWDARWLDRPDQPAIVASTVDQFGSRLLFRGYGVSTSLLPINAALCGTDAWVVIDEAHIVIPLVETVERVHRLQQAEQQEQLRPIYVTTMSATLLAQKGDVSADQLASELSATSRPAAVESGRLVAEPEREQNAPSSAAAIAMRRLAARKPARLKKIEVAGKGVERYRRLGTQLANFITSQMAQTSHRLAVLCNTVQTARAAFNDIVEKIGGNHSVYLLTGRMREYERSWLTDEVLKRFGAEAQRRPETSILVATQTIEVGADLDFDAIITECAPLSTLIQRFGRVRRLGNDPPNGKEEESVVVYAPSVHGSNDPIYGNATTGTWTFLCQHTQENRIDFSYDSIRSWRALPPPAECEPAQPFVPVLLGAHVERWAHTSPVPSPDQAVAPFLHGFQERSLPIVFIAWRAVPPSMKPEEETDEEELWRRWLTLAPLTDWERVQVPLPEVLAFLASQESKVATSDLETFEGTAEDQANNFQQGTRAVILDDEGAPHCIRSLDDVRPFATIVLESSLGGYDRWGWNGQRATPEQPSVVPDVADLAPSRKRRSLRFAPIIAASFAPEKAADLYATWKHLDPDDPVTTAADVLDAFAQISSGPISDLYREAAEGLRTGTWEGFPPKREDDGRWSIEEDDRPVLRIVERQPQGDVEFADQSDDDVVSTSLFGRVAIGLEDHGEAVGQLAQEFAEHLGLPETLVRAVTLAGRFHDLGKADPRFQALLYDGDALAAASGALRAKSGRDPRDSVARDAWRIVGLPEGFRHEATSGRLLRELAQRRVEAFSNVDLELVHHLVVAHHGHARPLLPAVMDRSAPSVQLPIEGLSLKIDPVARQVDWEHPAIFERLCQRYGWWGLAMLEAIVRLADMKASEEWRGLEKS